MAPSFGDVSGDWRGEEVKRGILDWTLADGGSGERRVAGVEIGIGREKRDLRSPSALDRCSDSEILSPTLAESYSSV